MDLIVGPDGTIRFIYDDGAAALVAGYGERTIRRASHVEPHGSGWAADMAPCGGPLLLDGEQPFQTRAAALAAEREWLDLNNVPVPLAR